MYVNCFLFIPQEILDSKLYKDYTKIFIEEKEYVKIYCDNTERDVIDSTIIGTINIPKFGPSRYEPILPTRNHFIEHVILKNDFNFDKHEIHWDVYADNAKQIRGIKVLKEICPIVEDGE